MDHHDSREVLVFKESVLKRESFFFSLTPFFKVKIDICSLHNKKKRNLVITTKNCPNLLIVYTTNKQGSSEIINHIWTQERNLHVYLHII